MKALIVDGRTETRRALVAALARVPGVTVQCSIPDRETAARVLVQYTPDLLVIGTQLTDGDSIAFVEEVRRRGMAIVVVGAAETRDVWRRYLAAGADRFVEPDLGFVELRDVVGALIQRRARGEAAAGEAAAGEAAAGEVAAAPAGEAAVVADASAPASPIRAAGSGPVRIPSRAAGSGPVRIPSRASSGIVHAFNSHIHSIELILEVLERSPDDKHLWAEARIALERAVSMTALLLGHVHGHHPRRRPAGPARGARGTADIDPRGGGCNGE